MRDAFLKQLEELHKMLAEMGLLCEKMIDGTYEALMHMDREQAAKILQDDANVDLKERDIESKCLKLLLEQQPVASDLRKISSALKMITDLERIGDQAGDIAEIIKTTDLLEPVKATRLGEMAKAVASMVRESIESFANEDLKKTKEVIAYDDVIDDMFSQVKKELADGIFKRITYCISYYGCFMHFTAFSTKVTFFHIFLCVIPCTSGVSHKDS